MLSSVIGHEELKKRLSKHFKTDPIGTYLFYGPHSVGKRTTAYEASKALLCLSESKADCICDSCKRFEQGHPDFLTVGQFEKIKVADIDRVLDFVTTGSFISKYKIILIDNAHDITWEAANRLLKILEEPPENFIFFLITNDPSLLVPTILSRCIKFRFNGLSREDLTNIIWHKLGFSCLEAKTLGWLAAGSSIDIFSKAGQYLKYRMMAYDFLSSLNTKKCMDALDFIDKIEKTDIPIFIDLLMIVLNDFLLLKNNISDIANEDLIDNFKKAVQNFNDKALVGAIGIISQVKRNEYLNINLNMNLKNAIIKTYPLFQVAP